MKRLFSLCAFASILLFSTLAIAQYQAPPPPPPNSYGPPPAQLSPPTLERNGFMWGFSVGGGTLTGENCSGEELECSESGAAVSVSIGAALQPKLGIMLDGSVVMIPLDHDYALNHVVSTIALQYWVSPNVWIKGGLGVGRFTISDPDGEQVGESQEGAAIMAGAGYEIYQGSSFVIDLQTRIAVVQYEISNESSSRSETFTNASVAVGFNWY